jgi:hypothetical protein
VSARAIRQLVIVVFVGGIAGMIVGSILDNNGVALTFGLITAAAAVGLILVTTVAGPAGATRSDAGVDDEAAGQRVEAQVDLLVRNGAEEGEVRELVRRVMDLAQARRRR